MSSSTGLSRVGITIQGLFLTAKQKVAEMNLNLSTEVTWAFTCLRVSSLVSRGWLSYSTRCVWLHYRWAQTGRTVPRVGFIRIILSENICFWHDWLHLIIDTSRFLLYFSCQKNNKSKLCVHIKCFFVFFGSVFL